MMTYNMHGVHSIEKNYVHIFEFIQRTNLKFCTSLHLIKLNVIA